MNIEWDEVKKYFKSIFKPLEYESEKYEEAYQNIIENIARNREYALNNISPVCSGHFVANNENCIGCKCDYLNNNCPDYSIGYFLAQHAIDYFSGVVPIRETDIKNILHEKHKPKKEVKSFQSAQKYNPVRKVTNSIGELEI